MIIYHGELVRPEPHRQGGFTIVEVVVALTILSLVLLATISAMRTFGNTQTSLDRMTHRIDELRSVSGFLRDTLESAVVDSSVSGRDVGGLALGPTGSSQSAYFQGDAASLSWKAPVFFGEGTGGTYLVRVVRIDDELFLQWQDPPFMPKNADWTDAEQRELLREVEEFGVSFKESLADEWQSEWGRDSSPALVKLVIKAGGRYWPELIMQVPQ